MFCRLGNQLGLIEKKSEKIEAQFQDVFEKVSEIIEFIKSK